MSDRDYRSYNILEDEIEENEEEQENDLAQEEAMNGKIDLTKQEEEMTCEVVSVYKQDLEPQKEQIIDVAIEHVEVEEPIEENKVSNVMPKEQNKENYKAEDHEQGCTFDSKDTSFNTYRNQDKQRKKGGLEKWLIRLIKLVVFMMLLPFIALVGGCILGVVGLVSGGIIACIAGGLAVIGTVIFVASKLALSGLLLGILIGIALISFGCIIVILSLMCMKLILNVIRNIRNSKKQAMKGGI